MQKIIVLLLLTVIIFTACASTNINEQESTVSDTLSNYETENSYDFTESTESESNTEDSSNPSEETSQNNPEHEHIFSDCRPFMSSCQTGASILFICECGEELRVVTSQKGAHNYILSITEPTDDTPGFLSYTCLTCWDEYTSTVDIFEIDSVDKDICGESLVDKTLPLADTEEAYAQAQKIIEQLSIDETTRQKDAIVRINNWLCNNKQYGDRDDTLYGLLIGTTGDSHNYAEAFQLLCLTAGINCRYYQSEEENRAWNVIYFSDGTRLWVDVGENDNDDIEFRNQYLLLDDTEFANTHTIQ